MPQHVRRFCSSLSKSTAGSILSAPPLGLAGTHLPCVCPRSCGSTNCTLHRPANASMTTHCYHEHRLLLAAVTNAIQEDPSNSPAFRCQSEAQCERLQAVKHPASNRRQILAALRKNGFVVVRGDDSSGFFGSVATLDAAQAAAESALDELREEYDAQLFTQARFPRAFPKKLPAAPWLYGALGHRVAKAARETSKFWYREGYSCASTLRTHRQLRL